MNTQQRGAEVIRRAEGELRSLIAEATESSNYEDLLVLAEWAKRLNGILSNNTLPSPLDREERNATIAYNGDPSASTSVKTKPRMPVVAPTNKVGSKRQASPAKQSSKAKAKKGSARTGAAKKNRPAYPKFMRDGDHLVKIGWSKKEKAQYEHKSPKSVLGQLLESLLAAGREGHRFTTEDVLPLYEAADGSEIPSYQAYLCLAWLRSESLIEQHGRQGYSLVKPDRLAASAEECWERLARR